MVGLPPDSVARPPLSSPSIKPSHTNQQIQ
ncbi:hypothetical protein CIPAW_05G021700 [Carya illinoinensis]|uniref:Uncharacterized protein n=1 Tax=Carya illinoinensis TaxID=32201 RepID=A0A8T1QE53_CARIL|nr:hypothetical protein CIPAW_05G021700 [Carya illinoinensis]